MNVLQPESAFEPAVELPPVFTKNDSLGHSSMNYNHVQSPFPSFKSTKTKSHNVSFPNLVETSFIDNLATNVVEPKADFGQVG